MVDNMVAYAPIKFLRSLKTFRIASWSAVCARQNNASENHGARCGRLACHTSGEDIATNRGMGVWLTSGNAGHCDFASIKDGTGPNSPLFVDPRIDAISTLFHAVYVPPIAVPNGAIGDTPVGGSRGGLRGADSTGQRNTF
jgi:hypothetical protein